MSRPAVVKHLRVLESAGLVGVERVGRQRKYELRPDPLRSVDMWMDRYRVHWARRLMDLKAYAERTAALKHDTNRDKEQGGSR